jgi:hypothetical protein
MVIVLYLESNQSNKVDLPSPPTKPTTYNKILLLIILTIFSKIICHNLNIIFSSRFYN